MIKSKLQKSTTNISVSTSLLSTHKRQKTGKKKLIHDMVGSSMI